jgi:hypothetical protein
MRFAIIGEPADPSDKTFAKSRYQFCQYLDAEKSPIFNNNYFDRLLKYACFRRRHNDHRASTKEAQRQ